MLTENGGRDVFGRRRAIAHPRRYITTTKGAKSIVKALIPRVDPAKKVSEHTTVMYKCVDWLESLNDWEAAMEDMRNKYSRSTVAMHTRLF